MILLATEARKNKWNMIKKLAETKSIKTKNHSVTFYQNVE